MAWPRKVPGTATSFTDVSTAASTTYTYSLVAVDAAGNSSAPATTSAQTPAAGPPADTTKPAPPTNLGANAAPSSIALAWTAPTDTDIAGYTVSRDGTPVAVSATTSYADLDVAAGPHTYTVTAADGSANTSAPSSPASATAGPPPAPGLVSVTYAYELADRLTAITTASGSTTSFSIDALGRHTSRTVGTNPTETYSYLGTSDTVVAIATSAATTVSAIDAVGDRVATGVGTAYGYLLGDLHGNTAAALAFLC
jgi:YD repeat-containing protein